MIEVKNGKVRIVREPDNRVVSFADRASELEFASLLESGDYELLPLPNGVYLFEPRRKPRCAGSAESKEKPAVTRRKPPGFRK